MLIICGVSEFLVMLFDGWDFGGVVDCWFIDNGLINLILFCYYLMYYFVEWLDIIKEMYIVVRMLKFLLLGILLEIYCFIILMLWKDYENIQLVIFEYIIVVVGQFFLCFYQYFVGYDFWCFFQEYVVWMGLLLLVEG